MEEELLKKIDEISDEMISGIKRIVQIDSVQSEAKLGVPFGEGVNKALEEALKLASELGFETENVDHMVGIAKYGTGEDYIGIMGHLDVVPVGEDGIILHSQLMKMAQGLNLFKRNLR